MNHKCPKCGHEWEEPSANQRAGGKARWKGTKAKQRSEDMRRLALLRHAKTKSEKPRAQNDQGQPRAEKQ